MQSEKSNSPSLVSSNPNSPYASNNNLKCANSSDQEGDIDLEDDDDNDDDSCFDKDTTSGHDKHNYDKDQGSASNMMNKRKKKTRTVFTRSQVFQLESTFDMKRYLSSSERAGLAASLHLTETQVICYFQFLYLCILTF